MEDINARISVSNTNRDTVMAKKGFGEINKKGELFVQN